ncbi:MAG: triose-phosphate isomerase [Bacteroidetes bacterium]|nr:triose-phosphate isomerase [Bacteroidota bacterium]MBP7398640.1 triose-phosphate isomerase [Chitinophagales bacterium]MBK8487681.1 triose-phosphate isomerase [Bacteroidota bacterium]MBK8682577.1 triose-phosphate isomerase [Bacteroidota bacterium]MBP8753658.1 triose-phosphate isomerase [Chitinophagales bacterium]
MRKKLVAGNWKMHKTLNEAEATVAEIANGLSRLKNYGDIWIAPTTVFIRHLFQRFGETGILFGAQNLNEHDQGAYTGEISAPQLLSIFASFVIVGHSERRQIYKESDYTIHQKVLAGLRHELPVILCCGETIEERNANNHFKIVESQLKEAFTGVSHDAFRMIIIAYEPVWAIGTGVNASPAQAQEMHAFIRSQLQKMLGETVAEQTRILYGGSVKPNNAAELFGQKDIDGALVGGASLQAEDFLKIIEASRTP